MHKCCCFLPEMNMLANLCYLSAPLYGAESRITTQKESQKIDNPQQYHNKRIIQEPQSTPNNEITTEAHILNIQTLTCIKQLNNYMKMNEMYQNRSIKQTWKEYHKVGATHRQNKPEVC